MSVTLIVTTSIDRDFNKTGGKISKADWIDFVESDSVLDLRTEPFVETAPDGTVIKMSVRPGQSEMTLNDGTRIPFLAWYHGELSMRYHYDMENPSNPVRQKVTQIARRFGALITTDAGDEFLDW